MDEIREGLSNWYVANHGFYLIISMKSSTSDLYAAITNKIIDLLDQHLDSWDCPWIMTDAEGALAYNAKGENQYRGINQLLLTMTTHEHGYAKNAWLTFKQTQELGGTILKGSKSTPVLFWKFVYRKEDGSQMDEQIAEKLNATELHAQGITAIPILKHFNVFNTLPRPKIYRKHSTR